MAFAIEELLRFEAPLQTLARTTTRDVEAHDTVIPEGAGWPLWASANRDERRWDEPDRLDITRQPQAMSRSAKGSTIASELRWLASKRGSSSRSSSSASPNTR